MENAGPSLPVQGRRARLELAPDAFELWTVDQPQAPIARYDRTQLGWEAAWREFYRLEHSGWRSVKAGWIALHGLVIGFFGFSLLQGAIIALLGSDNPDLVVDSTNGARLYVGGSTALVLGLTGAAGWLLFVYLRASRAIRWAALVGALVVGVAIGYSMG
jgi:hypothetical protein